MEINKNLKNQIIVDFIMIPVSIFMAWDYYSLILSGDDTLRRKIVLFVWIIAIIGWSVKLIFDLRTNRLNKK